MRTSTEHCPRRTETFETVDRYKPDALAEQMENFDERGMDSKDPFGPFTDLEDYEVLETTGPNVADSSTREFLIT